MILYKHKKKVEDRDVARISQFSVFEPYSKTFKIKILKYVKPLTIKRGQYLYHENDKPDLIYLLIEGSITFLKEFQILRSQDKDIVHFAKFSFKNNSPFGRDYIDQDDDMVSK